jgi:hypothetical protein
MQNPQRTDRPCLGAGSFDLAAWSLNPSDPGIVHFAKRNTTFCNKAFMCSKKTGYGAPRRPMWNKIPPAPFFKGGETP